MKYIKSRRMGPGQMGSGTSSSGDDDPLSAVANLFDVGLVFIVALLLALMSTYGMMDMLSETSEFTMVKKSAKGTMEIITKKGKNVTIKKVTDQKLGGTEATPLGTAYQLKNGKMIYVPEKDENPYH